jgi:hypothetical protein
VVFWEWILKGNKGQSEIKMKGKEKQINGKDIHFPSGANR